MLSAITVKCMNKRLPNQRYLWGWLNAVSNRFDKSRVDEVGIEVAAAEWLVRNGAAIKWTKSERLENDYNSLPKHNPGSDYAIEEIDATDSSIMSVGFPHLRGLKRVKKFVVKRNHYLDDEALKMLNLLKETLEDLQIVSCSNLTDQGIVSLAELQSLRNLKLFDLSGVSNKEKCASHLKSSLTKCEIDWQ